MFTDMVGSTALAERLGEDAFRKVMNRYYSAATAAVEANDGMVVEYMGDGILALFTSGVAGPDHATKACLAAQQVSESPLRRPDDPDPERPRELSAALRHSFREGRHWAHRRRAPL